jgi:hypothetical protein
LTFYVFHGKLPEFRKTATKVAINYVKQIRLLVKLLPRVPCYDVSNYPFHSNNSGGHMLHKSQLRSCLTGVRVLVLFAMLAVTLLATPALAEANGPVITVERLHGIGVGINFVFPENVSADLHIFLNGKMMDCELVALNTLYCIGTLRPNQTVSLQTYDGTSTSVTFTTAVTGPALNNFPTPPPDPCIRSAGQIQLGGFKLASPTPISIICHPI